MGWGGFSIGAIRKYEAKLAEGSIEKICTIWGVTHDIGLGIFTWVHSIPYIVVAMGKYDGYRVDEGSVFEEENYSAIWHKAFNQGMKYDELFELIWRRGGVTHNENRTFNIKEFRKQEQEQGRVRDMANHLYPNGGFKNTIFYRNLSYNQAIASQIQEGQQSKFFQTDVIDYGPDNCLSDKALFDAWEADHPRWAKAEHINQVGVVDQQPEECLEYSEYVSNLPVKFSHANAPDPADLYRKKRSLRNSLRTQ